MRIFVGPSEVPSESDMAGAELQQHQLSPSDGGKATRPVVEAD